MMAAYTILPAALLAGGCSFGFRRAGYAIPVAFLLTALLGLQAGVVLSLREPGHSLWLALGLAALAASAAAFAERESARRLIAFGGALAAIQICDPSGGLVAAGMLPAALTLGGRRHARHEALGLYVLLLFVPVLTAALLFYAVGIQHLDLLPVPIWDTSLPHGGFARGAMIAVTPAIVAAPALLSAWRTAAGRSVLFVAIAMIAAAMIAAWMGTIREPITLLATAVPLLAVGLVVQPKAISQPVRAIGVVASGTALSWGVFFLLLQG